MKPARIIMFSAFVLVFTIVHVSAQEGCISKVCLNIISHRSLTTEEKDKNPLSFQSVAMRVRLFNGSGHEISYLTGFQAAEPLYFRLYRKKEQSDWTTLPRVTKRNEASFKQAGLSGEFRYVRLAPNSSIEFEINDWSVGKSDEPEDHAFSIFIKFDSRNERLEAVELISNIFPQVELIKTARI